MDRNYIFNFKKNSSILIAHQKSETEKNNTW